MRWKLGVLLTLMVSTNAAAALAQPPPPPPPLTPLPPPPQPPGNPVTTAKANLGKALFWDEQLSSTRTVACGSCHQAGRGGSDPRTVLGSAHSTNAGADAQFGTPDDVAGSPGIVLNQADGSFAWAPIYGMNLQVTSRLAPSFVNAAYAPLLFCDGRAGETFLDPQTGATILVAGGALENQSTAPPISSVEMGHLGRTWSDVSSRVATLKPLMLSSHVPSALSSWINGRPYPELFGEAFGSSEVTGARIAMAIASYERTLYSTQTPFDSVIAGVAALTPLENQGRQLFGALGCAGCHAGSLMSDERFHYIGVRPAAEDPGREAVTGDPNDLGAFRTPSLRNVALRPAYFHDGRFNTLEEVVDFYDRGGDFTAANKPPVIRPLNLTPDQKAALLAFLRRPLTDPRVASEEPPFDRPGLYGETGLVPRVLDGGVAGGSESPPIPVAPEPMMTGNPQLTIGVHDALAGAPAVLVLDTSPPAEGGAIPAAGSFARLAIVLQKSPSGEGFGSVTMAIPDDPTLAGTTLFGRWYVADPGAPSGIATSPLIQFTLFGPYGAIGSLASSAPVAGPATTRLDRAWPNPFSARSTVRFTLASATRARLTVYDVSGRAVRRLMDHAVTPGAYSAEWDGHDASGASVPGGVYFLRLETEHDALSTRVVRLP